MEDKEEYILDLEFPQKGIKKVKIGELTSEVIDKLNIDRKPCNIVMSRDKLKYTEKHKDDFKNESDYFKCVQKIPAIINNPDYVGLHPNDDSIQYIKRVDELMLVGVRIKQFGEMYYTTAYPISETKLQNYINNNRIFEM